MQTWHKEIQIPAPIETVWNLFQLDQIQRIMPNVVEHKPLEIKEGVVGSTYQQTYKEGKRTETYIVTDIEHENTPNKKHNKIEFSLAKVFKIQAAFTLIKVDDQTTTFIYTGQNEGINLMGRILTKLATKKQNEKVVNGFVELVRTEALKDLNKES
ncbi:SRPBCC family protein [Psychrobacillus vulpis]|uniref:SRPBCC family protein n=1 Tax=Psychrobacillus vulpis TaxID=2325572 RepID=A0A544TUV8_9BACI|nr:SRPBCC family protein [Psychrobacillus vulpis]TQR21215.1 SRPBCC family protein [Psychrobacillus vulpis]